MAADRVTPAVPGAVATLDDAQRDWIVRALRQDGIAPTPACIARLLQAVAASMAAFATAQRAARTHRERHDALRAIWQLAHEDDPPVGQIRALLPGLPPGALDAAGERARRLWARIFAAQIPTGLSGAIEGL